MKIPKPVLPGKSYFALLCLTALMGLIYSCRKDKAASGEPPAAKDNSLVADVRSWYQKNAPALTASTGSSGLQTLSTGEGGSSKSWSDGLNPLWDSTHTFQRDSYEVVEAPLNNATLYFVENQTSVNPTTMGKNYTKTAYVFTRNKAGSFSAYLMVIIGDPAYVNNPANHFQINNYQTREANFSGKVLYYNLGGRLLSGYRYKDGQINGTVTQVAGPAGTAASPALRTEALKTLLRDAGGCETRAITIMHYSCVSAGDSAPYCTPYYTTTYYQICDDGSGGGSGGGGTGGGSGGGGGGGGGTFPPAPNPPTDPDNNDPADPCKQAKYVSAKAQNATVKDQNDHINAYTSANNAEYGTNQKLSSPDGSGTPINTQVTPGQTSTWQPTPTWNSTDGYTVGFSHGHPGGAGPSPADVWAIFLPIFMNNDLKLAPQAQRDFYQLNASVTTLMPNGSYIVTIKDWSKITDIYNALYSNQQQENAFKAQYQTYADNFARDTQSDDIGMAGAYALMKMFPDAINVYAADTNSTVYHALALDNSSSTPAVKNPCPTNPNE
ncbi:hypothetical protein [Mucilaginibacter sp.]